VPFGGRVTSVIPCSQGLYFTVLGPKGFGGAYIWTPGSLTFPWGPPRPTINILGIGAAPDVCYAGTVPLFGLHVRMEGSSQLPGIGL
jgi:hypothetical protein